MQNVQLELLEISKKEREREKIRRDNLGKVMMKK
jgi:hypothetical protein